MDRIVDADGLPHEIVDLRYHHGKHELSMMPGFCGNPTVVPGARPDDAVAVCRA